MAGRILSAFRGGSSEPGLRKLRNRLLAVNLVSLTLVVIVAFSIIYIDFYNRTQNEINMSIESIPPGVFENVALSKQMASPSGSGQSSENTPVTISGGPAIPVDYSKSFVVNVHEDDSITVYSVLDYKERDYFDAAAAALEQDLSKGKVKISDRTYQYDMKKASDLPRTDTAATYRVSIIFLDVEEAERGLRELAVSLIIIGIIAICAILFVSLFVANRAIRPVEESMSRQKRFIADASHELKTPIAVIAANAEAAKDAVFRTDAFADPGDAANVTRWIDIIAEEATRMDSLVKNLLALARTKEAKINAVQFDLLDAIREESDRVEVFLFEKNIAFIFDPPSQNEGQLTVCSDRAKTKAILSILLENAVKYTPDGGRVTITAGRDEKSKRSKDGSWVSVSSTGDYIPPEDIERIFDRFFRTDRSRNSETGGHGIGLSIAKEIAKTLGGDISATSEQTPLGDALNTFTLYL